jgi:hypothetical protein
MEVNMDPVTKISETPDEPMVTTPSQTPNTKGFWKVIMIVLILIVLVFVSGSPSTSTPEATQTKTKRAGVGSYSITTETWTEIKVGYGKRITNLRIQSQNGRVYDWYIVINKDFKNPRKMPSGENLGNNVQTIDCLLARDQGVDTALVDYSEK